MSLRTLYGLAGAAWGLVLGVVAGFVTVAYALGFSWLFLFGDSTWPEAAVPAILGLGVAVFLALFISLAAVGYVYGRRLEGPEAGAPAVRRPDPVRHRRRAFALMAAAGVTALLLVGAGAARELADARDREARSGEEAAFADLVTRRHAVERIEVDATSEGDLVARVHLAGERSGDYRLSRRVSEPTYDSTLIAGEDTYTLTDSQPLLLLTFSVADLREAYRDRVLAGRGGVLVEQDFELALVLQPILTSEEIDGLPERELQNLSLGDSPLIDRATADLPVRFTIR